MTRAGVMLALAMVLAGEVAAQAAGADRLARLDAGTRAAVMAAVDSARAKGLPTEPLIEKALEGAIKGAPGSRIGHAVRMLSMHLQTARWALGPEATEPELVAGAAVVRGGLAPSRLMEIRQVSKRERLGVPLAVLSDLMARGVPVDTAAKVIEAMVAANASDDDFDHLARQVGQDLRLGAEGGSATWVRGRGWMGGRGTATPGRGGGLGPGGPGGRPGHAGQGGKPGGGGPPPA